MTPVSSNSQEWKSYQEQLDTRDDEQTSCNAIDKILMTVYAQIFTPTPKAMHNVTKYEWTYNTFSFGSIN